MNEKSNITDIYVLGDKGKSPIELVKARAPDFADNGHGSIVLLPLRRGNVAVLAGNHLLDQYLKRHALWAHHLESLLVVLQEKGLDDSYPTSIAHIAQYKTPGVMPRNSEEFSEYTRQIQLFKSSKCTGYSQHFGNFSIWGEEQDNFYDKMERMLFKSGKFEKFRDEL